MFSRVVVAECVLLVFPLFLTVELVCHHCSPCSTLPWREFLGERVRTERATVILRSLERILAESRESLQTQRDQFASELERLHEQQLEEEEEECAAACAPEQVFQPVTELACTHIRELTVRCAQLQCDHTVLLLAALDLVARWSLSGAEIASLEYAEEDGRPPVCVGQGV
jgi:hypothetical protein